MSKKLNKFITPFNYADKTLLLFSGAACKDSYFSFTSVTSALASKISAGISIAFLVNNGIVRLFKETIQRKKTNTERLPYWPQAN